MTRDDALVGKARRSSTRSYRSAGRAPSLPLPGVRQSKYLAGKENNCRAKYFIGVRGDIVTLADLPSPRTKRWVIRRKAEIVSAVDGGLLTLEDACERYQLTVEEFFSWKNAFEHHGVGGLRSTHLQDHRHSSDKN